MKAIYLFVVKDREYIKNLYQESKFLICTSEYESFYMVPLEGLHNYSFIIISSNKCSKESVKEHGFYFQKNS